MRKKTTADNNAHDWLNLVNNVASTWFTPELVHEVSKKAEKYIKKGKDHYYDIDEFGMDPLLIDSLRPFFQFFYENYWKVDVVGIKNIPAKSKALIVSNHSGAIPFDGIMLNMAVFNEHPKSRDLRFLVEDFVYHFPFLGTFIQRTGGIRACPENAEKLLKVNNLVAVFPEGIKGIGKLYKERYKLHRFGRNGYVKIAIKAQSKIIPTAIIGAEETYPVLAKSTFLSKPFGIPYFPITPTFPLFGPLGAIPLPSKWIILFGKPIDCSQYKKSDANNNLLAYKINQRVRRSIKKMIADGLSKRESVYNFI